MGGRGRGEKKARTRKTMTKKQTIIHPVVTNLLPRRTHGNEEQRRGRGGREWGAEGVGREQRRMEK